MTAAELRTLELLLCAGPDGLTRTDLAEALGSSYESTGPLLARLRRQRLARRSARPARYIGGPYLWRARGGW